MNTLEVIKEKISMIVPNASISLDSSETFTGSSWLDIKSDNQSLTIEYKPSLGFGLYASVDNSFDLGPDEIYRNVDSLLKRISMLLIEHKINIKLKEVRELLGKTQEEISILSGQKQPSISKLESRTDLQFSTIEKFVSVLGGSLEIKAHFDEFDVPIDISSNNKTTS
jgi:hypothetical protein